MTTYRTDFGSGKPPTAEQLALWSARAAKHVIPEGIRDRLATIRTLAKHLLSAGYTRAELQAMSEEKTGLAEFQHLTCVGVNDLDDLISYFSLLWMGSVIANEAPQAQATWERACHRCRGPDGMRFGAEGRRYCLGCRPGVLRERRETKEQQMKAGY